MSKPKGGPDSVVCTNCLNQFAAWKKLSPLGFKTYLCPRCNTKVYYPLAGDHFGCFVAVLIAFGIITVTSLASGKVAIPGLIAVLAVPALINNARIKRRTREAEGKARALAAPPPEPAG